MLWKVISRRGFVRTCALRGIYEIYSELKSIAPLAFVIRQPRNCTAEERTLRSARSWWCWFVLLGAWRITAAKAARGSLSYSNAVGDGGGGWPPGGDGGDDLEWNTLLESGGKCGNPIITRILYGFHRHGWL